MPKLEGHQSKEEPVILLVEFGDDTVDTFMQLRQPSKGVVLALRTWANMD